MADLRRVSGGWGAVGHLMGLIILLVLSYGGRVRGRGRGLWDSRARVHSGNRGTRLIEERAAEDRPSQPGRPSRKSSCIAAFN